MMLLPLVASFVFLATCGATAEKRLLGSSYIVGGKEASQANWPWQASLQVRGQHVCGASLISSRWLVTAAHCIMGAPYDYTVVLGMHDQDRKLGAPEDYKAVRTVRHPSYNADAVGFPNDIALMYLSEDANIDENMFIKPVPLAAATDDFSQENCYITGWGKTEGGYPDRLQVGEVRVYSQQGCKNEWGRLIGDYHVCVGNYGNQAACTGDSGGPLVCGKDGRFVLVGTASWADGSCSTWLPSVYSSITYFREWIRSVTSV